MDAPQLQVDTPSADAEVVQPFTVAGWTFDPRARTGLGIDTLHLWAYPVDGGNPRWVGVAALGGRRPDVAALFGSRFEPSGFTIEAAGLPAGLYDIVVYAHSVATDSFAIARAVRVNVK
jgi:hypothetical protein